MQYTNRQGLSISRITLGTVALGKAYGISNDAGKPDPLQSAEVFQAAIQAGINTLDTANDYGNAEELIGKFIQKNGLESQTVTVTKFKISKENLGNKKLAKAEAYRSIQSSLKLLQLKRIPVCLYHKESDVPVDLLSEILPGIFSDMQNDGLIDIAGVSIYHPNELKTFSLDPIFKAFQVPMNIFDHRLINLHILGDLQHQDKIVFIRSVFLQGLFFMAPESLKGTVAKAATYLRKLKEIAESERMSVVQMAFSFVRDTPGVTSVVFGAVSPSQVRENAALLEGPSLSNAAIANINKLIVDIPDDIIIPGKW